MQHSELLDYYDGLLRLALQKCGNQPDAEDLVSDTMLAAYMYLYQGGIIEHPKTWLTHTLLHKYNSQLRKKYRAPVTVTLDSIAEVAEADEVERAFADTDEAAEVRRTLLYLANQTREVLIRHYYRGQSVAQIAAALGIPEGTVKSRLWAGREKMKKGLEDHMKTNTNSNRLPGYLALSLSGWSDPFKDPVSVIEQDLIAQNLLAIAYEKPLDVAEMADAIGIPTVYIEPIVNRLVACELLVKTAGDKVYTDFVIYQPEDTICTFAAQKALIDEHFREIWGVVEDLSAKVCALPYTATLSERKKQKLMRYVILRTLQDIETHGTQKKFPSHPARRDGGQWTAMGFYFPAGYDDRSYKEILSYQIQGGHRTTSADLEGQTWQLCEFDTDLYDAPHRYSGFGYENRYSSQGSFFKLLVGIHRGEEPTALSINNALIEGIPSLITVGLLSNEGETLALDIPVLPHTVFGELNRLISEAYGALMEILREPIADMIKGIRLTATPHTKSIPELFLVSHATRCLAMLTCRRAYEEGLHLKDVDYCCPPVILVCDDRKQ